MITYATEAEISEKTPILNALQQGMNNVLFGQEQVTELVLIGLLARGHILLEGQPGLGKTELVKGLAQLIQLHTKRIQFTPDLLPGDITGNPVLQERDGNREFVFQPGPIFTQILLADEINRASPKTQSSLLEAMQERHVTVLGTTHALPAPFFVLATQNPIELEGTYPLPEAQLDRFLFKIELSRNSVATLEQILQSREIGLSPHLDPVMDLAQLESLLALVRKIFLPEPVANYIARLVEGTHAGTSLTEHIRYGASPRAALAMASAAKARALLFGRPNASFEDVKAIAPAVLRHRILLEYSAKLSGFSANSLIEKLLAEIPFHEGEMPKTLQTP